MPLRRIAHVDVETDRAGIDEDRPGTDARDATARGEKGEAGAEHLVAGPDAEGHQGDENRIRAGAEAERVLRAGELGQRALKPLDLGPEDEVPGAQHAA